jgi:hypothetical protein
MFTLTVDSEIVKINYENQTIAFKLYNAGLRHFFILLL